MRVLALNWRDIRSPEAGGAEVHLYEILKRLVARGHEATVVCSHFAARPSGAAEMIDGVRTIRTGAWWNAHVAVPAAARRLIAAEPFDVLVDDVNKIPFFAPSWSKIPVVAVFHHLLGRTVFRETNPFLAGLVYAYEHRVGRAYRTTPTVAVSESTRSELIEKGLPRESVSVIENGLDHELFATDGRAKPVRATFAVVSRLKAYKRVDVAIRAFARICEFLPDAELVVMGDGDQRLTLDRLARRLDLRVHFTGKATHAEKFSLLNRAHLTLLPSMKEGFGLVAIESMACGTPVIASDVPGHRDSVPEGAGVLVESGDPEAMAFGALHLLKDEVRYRLFRDRGLSFVRRFSWDKAADLFEDLLSKAAGLPVPDHVSSLRLEAVR